MQFCASRLALELAQLMLTYSAHLHAWQARLWLW